MKLSCISVSRPLTYLLALLLQLSFSITSFAADITQQQLLTRIDTNTAPLLLDVRRPDEFATGHVPHAINIPHTELDRDVNKLHTDINNEIVVYCESGRRAAIAMDILKQAGFTKVLHLQGDMKAWRMHELPIESNGSQMKH